MAFSLTHLFQIEVPIIQAPMAGAQGPDLAIAVANAGGLGSLLCAMLSVEQVHNQVEAFRTSARGRPINLNFFCHEEPRTDPARMAAWRRKLEPYYEELRLDPAAIAPARGGQRRPFDLEMANAIAELRPEVVSFHFGLPSPDLLARVRDAGAKILSSATSEKEARWLEEHGADVIIAQGVEAGGHRGHFLSKDPTTLGTADLVQQFTRAVSVPVVAAGGIANAAGVASALNLGAAAVQIGTSYLLCRESTISSVFRAALKSEDAPHTAVTNVITGRPARGILNRIMRELGPMNSHVPEFPLASDAMAPLRARAESIGRSDFSPLWAGQNVSGCREVSAAELTHALAEYWKG